MKQLSLTLETVRIKDICFGSETKIENNVLIINKEELIDLLADKRLSSIDIEIAKPGESVRIVPVKDAIEPRIKPDTGEFFPGVLGGFNGIGEGRTRVLKDCCVITTGQIVFFQEGLIDMSGPGQIHSIYANMNNAVLVAEPAKGIEPAVHEAAIRMAGLKMAHYLAKAAVEVEPDEIRTYTLDDVSDKKLPKMLYVNQILAQGLLHDNYVYGTDAKKLHPMLMHPNEMMDGALVSGNCVTACDKTTTYDHMNNPVVREMYDRHGVDLEFCGVINLPVCTTLAEKERGAMSVVNLAAGVVRADAIVVSEEGGGNPEADLMMLAEKAEAHGIKTVIMLHENAGEQGASEPITDSSPAADAVVTAGNNNVLIHLPKMDKIIGHSDAVNLLSGGIADALQPDGSVIVRLAVIMDSGSNLGITKLSGITY